MSLFDQIPGLSEAVERERAVRELAMLDIIVLCGIPCRQVSVRTYTLLCGMESPFFNSKRPCRIEDVAVYLWLHCLEYREGDEKSRIRWVKRNVRPLAGRVEKCILEITRHITDSFMDSPGPGNQDGKEYFIGSAALIDQLAAEYGWTDDFMMRLPVARLFQYQRAMTARYGGKGRLSNPSDRLISDHLLSRMRQENTPSSN